MKKAVKNKYKNDDDDASLKLYVYNSCL